MIGKEYRNNVVFPTRLTFEDTCPEDSGYETPESVEFIRNFNFRGADEDE